MNKIISFGYSSVFFLVLCLLTASGISAQKTIPTPNPSVTPIVIPAITPTPTPSPTPSTEQYVRYKGAFTVASLPTSGVNTGDFATVTDSTRGIWQFDGAKWVAQDGRRVNVESFCQVGADCTSGLQAAIDALNSLGGGTILFPAGKTYQFNSPLNLVQKRSITFEGTVTKGQTGTINLLYTGSGSAAAFNMLSSYELTFRNLHIEYNNSGFTGWLFQNGHNESGADTQQFLMSNCNIQGVENVSSAAGLVDLNLSIIGKIQDSHFGNANIGIRGITGAPNYAYLYEISNNTFNNIVTAIYNPDANWRIIGNTFEPGPGGKTVGLDSDNSYYIRGTIIEANYFGDASEATQPQIRLRRGLGVTVASNWFTVGANGAAMEFSECQGLSVTANRVESNGDQTTGIAFTGGPNQGYNYSVSVSNNSLNATYPISGGNTIGITKLSNETGGGSLRNEITTGLTVVGNAGTTPVGPVTQSVTLGSLYNTIDYNGGGAIRMTNALPGYPDGSMIIQAYNDGFTADIVLRTKTADAIKVNGSGVFLGTSLNGKTGAFSGDVTFPTQTAGDNSTKAATTAYVQSAINASGAASSTGSMSLDFPSIPASSTSELTISVSGATVGDPVTVSPSGGPENGLIWSGYVSASGTVKVRLANVTGSAIDPAARNWTAKVK